MIMGEDALHTFSVGKLAEIAGVSVRTLQYYDRTGLLKSTLSESGRRTYTLDDLFELQQILFLKSLGFPLDIIKNSLSQKNKADDRIEIFTKQRDFLIERMKSLDKIIETLNTIIGELSGGEDISLHKLMVVLQLMKEGNPYTFILHYFNDDQINSLTDRFDSPEKYEGFMKNSAELFSRLSKLYREKADPAGPAGQKLAEEWWAMAMEFSQGNPEMLKTLISSGKDIDNWPKEAGGLHAPIKNFLSSALNVYFQRAGIKRTEIEKGDNAE